MQGFAGLEAPPGMIYIATIPDGSGGTRITCCERQKVIEARMMMMGLNHNAMASVTNDGKTIIKQIIDYLLQFDGTDVTAAYRFRTDSLLNDNLIDRLQCQDVFDRLYHFMQVYNNRMISNELKPSVNDFYEQAEDTIHN